MPPEDAWWFRRCRRLGPFPHHLGEDRVRQGPLVAAAFLRGLGGADAEPCRPRRRAPQGGVRRSGDYPTKTVRMNGPSRGRRWLPRRTARRPCAARTDPLSARAAPRQAGTQLERWNSWNAGTGTLKPQRAHDRGAAAAGPGACPSNARHAPGIAGCAGRARRILRKSRAKRDCQEPVGEHSDGLPAKLRLKPPRETAAHAASLGALLAGPAKRGPTTSSTADRANDHVAPKGPKTDSRAVASNLLHSSRPRPWKMSRTSRRRSTRATGCGAAAAPAWRQQGTCGGRTPGPTRARRCHGSARGRRPWP